MSAVITVAELHSKTHTHTKIKHNSMRTILLFFCAATQYIEQRGSEYLVLGLLIVYMQMIKHQRRKIIYLHFCSCETRTFANPQACGLYSQICLEAFIMNI